MKEIVTFNILTDNLFNEVIDQTLFDYRNIAQADKYAMSKDERDIFDINIHDIIDNIYLSSLGTIKDVQYDDEGIVFSVQKPDNISDIIVASRLKDCIKYAILAWWHSTKNQPLYVIYQQRYELLWSNLKVSLVGGLEKPYSIY